MRPSSIMRPLSITLLTCVSLGVAVTSAHAGPCADAIVRLESQLRQSEQNPATGPTAAQSVGAQLSRQPTAESVKRAREQAQANFASSLDRAKALDAEGKTAECMQAVETARLKLELR
jgi:hypothetical protein